MDGCPQGVVECELTEALFNRSRAFRRAWGLGSIGGIRPPEEGLEVVAQ